MKISQAPSCVLMVRPQSFGFNPQTADTNAFQQHLHDTPESIREKALSEFDTMVDLLRSNDVDVVVMEDTVHPEKPDAVFPNNWISFHADGTVVLYPMLAENRRTERLNPMLDTLKRNYRITKTIDLTFYEARHKFLEGTGSIVFDYVNKIAYAARSARTNEVVLHDLAERLGFTPLVFDAIDEQGQAIYHTNVVLCIGTDFVVVCLDAIRKEEDQDNLLDSFSATGHKVISISFEQMKLFAGNMMEVKSRAGEPLVLLSQKAFRALLPGQLDVLSRFAEPVPITIPTIETHGGGSVRCMVAGIFTPEQAG